MAMCEPRQSAALIAAGGLLLASALFAPRASADAAIFLVPQVRCDLPPRGERVGPTGVGVLLDAIQRSPDEAGNYLDLARCHLTSGRPSRLGAAEDLLAHALTLIQAAAAVTPADPIDEPPAGAVRVGGAIPAPAKRQDAPATYPAAARAAGIGGVVFLDATIDPQGTVIDTRVLGSIPELDAAAQAAVRQWKYAPTLVNGQPATVAKIVTVKFSTSGASTPVDGIDLVRFYDGRGQHHTASALLEQTLSLVRDLRTRAGPHTGLPVQIADGTIADVSEPLKIWDARPVYPTSARDRRIQGLVTIEATIAKDGSVRNARVVRSEPGLDDAAIEAVRQWRYTPVVLNGQPLNDVILTVSVSFAL
jgi:TonB family protein